MSDNSTQFSPRIDSPLQHVTLLNGTGQGSEGNVAIKEYAACAHIIVRGNSGDPEFETAIKNATALSLPKDPCSSASNSVSSAYWLAPDEWLIISEKVDANVLVMSLRTELNGHYSVVDVSGAQTVISLSGKNAHDVIKKSCPYDVDLSALPVGKVVGTVFAKTTAHMIRVEESRFDLIVRRSFADYVCLWLQDASKEYGFTLDVGHQ